MTTPGTVTTEFGNGAFGGSVTIQADGKILVAGDASNAGSTDGNFALARYNANGTLDTSFDTDGKLTTDFGGNDWGSKIHVQSDGKILVAGSALNLSESVSMIGVARYNADGSLDTSFSVDGKVTTGVPSSAQGFGMAVQADGKVLVTGNGSNAVVLIRYNLDGSLDTGFDSDGKVSTVFSESDNGNSVVVQPDGKILVVGLSTDPVSYWPNVALARYNTNGTLDSSFDSDGKVIFRFNGSYAAGLDLKVLADGKILVSGVVYNSTTGASDVGLARLNANGSLDTSFGVGGIVTTNLGGDEAGANIAVQSDGKILVAGGDGAFVLLRYNADGSLDTQFSGDGVAHAYFGGVYESANGVTLQADGKIVVVGSTDSDTDTLNGGGKFAMARFNPDGSLDTTFGAVAISEIMGTSGNDTLDGGSAINALVGGDGSDLYHVRNSGDVVVETNASASTGGTDTVYSYLSSYTLGSHVENGRILSTGSANLIGNALNNVLFAGAGNNTLNGSTGVDTASYLYAASSVTVSLASTTVQVTGGSGSDTLIGIENLTGSRFNDILTGSAGNNVLDGGSGNDSLTGGAGADTLIGGAGADTLNGGVTLDHNFGTDDNFTTYSDATAAVTINLSGITGNGSTGSGMASGDASVGVDTFININLIQGSRFNDTITGSSARIFEQFEGGAGNDILNGGAITDMLNGDNDNRVTYQNATGAGVTVDFIAGTAVGAVGSNIGSDTLVNFNQVRGSNFNDTLRGSNRTDLTEQFEGRAGNDYIDGRGGFDIVRYSNATTQVVVNLVTGLATGAMGTDTLVGIEGVRGGSGHDILTGGNALNGVTISDGLTEVFRGEAGNDTIDGGQGYDRVDYTSATTGVTVVLNDTLDGTANDGLGGTDVLRHIEGVRGSIFNDALMGSNSAVFESFEGREGNDSINGSGGIDRADYQNARAGVTISLVTGIGNDGYGSVDTLSNIENLRGSRDFNDSLTGSTAANKLEGLGGNDTLNGGAGADNMMGGDGSDTYFVENSLDVVTETNATASTGGTDTVNSYLSAYTLGANVENGRICTITAANLTGNGLNNMLYAGGGNNVIKGGAGTDTVSYAYGIASGTVGVTVSLASTSIQGTGRSGSDTLMSVENLMGSKYADNLTGSTGNNVLTGGTGKDMLKGNGGNDTFDFNALSEMGSTSLNWDIISDFTTGDRIDLSTLDANTGTLLNEAFSATLVSSFTAAGQLKYDNAAHVLYGNTDSNFATVEFAIQLTGVNSLTAADFVL